jgi:hypothetical protein
MDENLSRERKPAIIDKKRSIANYIKLDDNNASKAESIRRLTGNNNIDLVNFIQEEKIKNEKEKEIQNNMFPKPPKFSNKSKSFISKDPNKLQLSSYASVISNFDCYKNIDHELCLVNLETYLAKFDEEELNDLKVSDLLSFDMKEFEKTKSKFEELVEVSKKFNDDEMILFFEDKLKHLQQNELKITSLLTNLEKFEDFVVLDETIKFFLKKNKK